VLCTQLCSEFCTEFCQVRRLSGGPVRLRVLDLVPARVLV
jgi:hypothetical protein